MKPKHLISIVTMLVFVACEPSSKNQQKANDKMQSSESCIFEYDPSYTEVNWTAYKFTEKTGVSGKFTSAIVEASQASENWKSVVEGTSFMIPIGTIDSENPDRDGKIRRVFFGNMTHSDTLMGQFTKVTGSDAEGKASATLKMNEISQEIEMQYQRRGNALALSTMLDLNNWNAQNAVQALNDTCHDLHIGQDGISKLWPEVKVEVVVSLKKDCPS